MITVLNESGIVMSSPESDSPAKLLTVAVVAQRLVVSQSLVYQLIESGRLGHHRIGTGRGTIRVSESDLESYLSECHADAQEISDAQPKPRPRKARLKHIRI